MRHSKKTMHTYIPIPKLHIKAKKLCNDTIEESSITDNISENIKTEGISAPSEELTTSYILSDEVSVYIF